MGFLPGTWKGRASPSPPGQKSRFPGKIAAEIAGCSSASGGRQRGAVAPGKSGVEGPDPSLAATRDFPPTHSSPRFCGVAPPALPFVLSGALAEGATEELSPPHAASLTRGSWIRQPCSSRGPARTPPRPPDGLYLQLEKEPERHRPPARGTLPSLHRRSWGWAGRAPVDRRRSHSGLFAPGRQEPGGLARSPSPPLQRTGPGSLTGGVTSAGRRSRAGKKPGVYVCEEGEGRDSNRVDFFLGGGWVLQPRDRGGFSWELEMQRDPKWMRVLRELGGIILL